MRSPAYSRHLLIAVAFLTFFDRALLPPLLPVVARDLGMRVESIGLAIIGYVIAYAGAQLLWSVVSSRIGRIRVLAVSTALSVAGITVSALAVDATMLVVGRTISGAALGATVPAVLTYFGDTLPMKQRAVAAANLATALSLGMTLGTIGASVTGEWENWRLAFGVTGVMAALLAALLFRVPEGVRPVPQRFIPAILIILRNRWALVVLGLTALEGALLVGIFSYLPVSLHESGSPIIIAGLATAAFGVSVLVFSQVTKLLVPIWPSWLILLIGGLGASAAFGLLSWSITGVTTGAAAILLGLSWALAHTQLQTWMTDAAADARPVGMSLFAVALFGGGAIGAAIGNAAVPGAAFTALYVAGAVGAVFFTVVASLARARYREQEE